MINALNLLWIVPLTTLISVFAIALCSAAGRYDDNWKDDEDYENDKKHY